MPQVLSGNAYWSFDLEVASRTLGDNLRASITGVLPFHSHEGHIFLTNLALRIDGDYPLQIPLGSIEQLYLGFDDVFPRLLVKSMGLLWQPLRIKFTDGYTSKTIYLIIDYDLIGTRNQLWFNTIKEILTLGL